MRKRVALIRFAGEAAAGGWWCEEEMGMFAGRSREAEHRARDPVKELCCCSSRLEEWQRNTINVVH